MGWSGLWDRVGEGSHCRVVLVKAYMRQLLQAAAPTPSTHLEQGARCHACVAYLAMHMTHDDQRQAAGWHALFPPSKRYATTILYF